MIERKLNLNRGFGTSWQPDYRLVNRGSGFGARQLADVCEWNWITWWMAYLDNAYNMHQRCVLACRCLHIQIIWKPLEIRNYLVNLYDCHETTNYTRSNYVNVLMMTSSNGNIFRVTDHLCGEFTGPRWIPCTKASDAELWCFLWSASE